MISLLIIGFLIIPSIGLREPVYETNGWRDAQECVDAPHVCRDRNVLMAHNTEQFKRLREIRSGDLVYFRSTGGTGKYRVAGAKLVSKYDMKAMDTEEMTLMTCTENMRYRLFITLKQNIN